jgi:hypothetical protein
MEMPERVSRRFKQLAREAGLPPIKLHAGRHTAASLALEAGVAMKVVSDQLGHSTTAIHVRPLHPRVQGRPRRRGRPCGRSAQPARDGPPVTRRSSGELTCSHRAHSRSWSQQCGSTVAATPASLRVRAIRGGRGIRTHGAGVTGTTVFKTAALGHYASPPPAVSPPQTMITFAQATDMPQGWRRPQRPRPPQVFHDRRKEPSRSSRS